MFKNQKLGANAAVSLGAVMVGVSLFGVTASAQFRPNLESNGTAIVFADPNFRGASATLRGDTPDLRSYRLNDKVSSIEIPRGQVWEICQDVNFQNACQTITTSVADLRTIGFDDRISSLRRVNGGFRNGNSGVYRDDGYGYPGNRYGNAGLVFYDRTVFRGTAMVVTNNNPNALGNRRARSVEVRGGTWQLCDRTGRCSTISQNVSDLAQVGLNGQITSVRPVNNSRIYGRQNPRDPYYGDPRDPYYGDPRQENNTGIRNV